MSVTVTPETEEQIRHWIDTGRYPDADAVIHRALAALEAQEQARFLKDAGVDPGRTEQRSGRRVDP